MSKHNLKFVKPLTSVMLGVAVLTSTIAVQPDTADAANSSNYKVSKGNLVSKTTGKIVKGTKTYKGKVYKNGKLLNGLKAGVFYKKGKKATGTYKGKYYSKGIVFTGLKAGIYYKAGAKATGTYQGKYFSKGKVYTGLKSGVYYKNGVTGTGMYQGEYYSEGSLFSGLIDGVYYEKGSKATGVYNGNYYENGNLFTGLQINTGYLYINGVLNTGLRLFNGYLYKGAIINDGVIQYDGKWYKGSSLASGTITTPDGKTITVDGGVEKPSSGSGSGGGYQSPLSIAINQAINALGALSYSKTNPIDSETKFTDAKSQYETAIKAVEAAFNKGAVEANFGSVYLKLKAQKDEINRYQKVIDDEKQEAIDAAVNAAKAKEVSDLIAALDKTSEKYKADIDAARAAYNNLTSTQRGLVKNIEDLQAAEKEIADEEDVVAAEKVADLIAALNNESEKYKDDVIAARAAYEALTDIQKPLVRILDALENAEAAVVVINKIADLDTDSTQEKIEEAREAYNGLSSQERKNLVTNYDKLEALEAALEVKIDKEKAQEVVDLIATFGQNFTEADLEAARKAYDGLLSTQKIWVDNYEELVGLENAFTKSLEIATNIVNNATNQSLIDKAQKAVSNLRNGKSKDELQDKLNLVIDVFNLSTPVYSDSKKTITVSSKGEKGSTITWIFNGKPTEVKDEKISTQVNKNNTLVATVENKGRTSTVKFTAKYDWFTLAIKFYK